LKPAFIRWPGGNVAQDYHWQWGVGPRDRRPTWVNLSWGDEPEPSDFGTDEFIAFSRSVGAEPSITVNVEGRGATVEEAAAWVEYCNGATSTKYGAMRAANGHPQPYGVKLWEIGNEIWGSWVRGHSNAETYAGNFQRYRDAMRRVDSSIRFIAVGDNDMDWNRTVLSRVGRDVDFLAIHHYYGGGPDQREANNLFARPLFFEAFYKRVDSLARVLVPGKRIRLAINEWGLDLPESQQYAMTSALYGARLMNVFERSAPVVAMSAVSDMVNGWPGGIIQASRTGTFVSPIYHVDRMYGAHLGAERLSSVVESPTFTSSREGSRIPALDAVASRSADSTQIFIKLVNTRPTPLDTDFRISGITVRPDATIETLSAADGARNSFTTPDAVSPSTHAVQAGSSFRVTLPPRSVSVLIVNRSR
jgi:alpha-N-arabinofuranosidase